MKNPKNRMRTYLRGQVSSRQKELFQEHMDHLGFESTSTPGEFAYDDEKYYDLVSATKDTLDNRSQLPMHSHSFMEIYQYISQTKVEYLIGTHRYILQQGDIVCVPSGICHQVLNYEPKDIPCVRYLVALSPVLLYSIGWNTQEDGFYLLRTDQQITENLTRFLQLAVDEYENREPRWRDALFGIAQILLSQILRNADASISAEKDGLFEKILTYVDSNLDQKITLLDTAQHFYISDRTINREFHKHLGISFYKYVTQRRLLKARNLIFNEIPLHEVCRRCGFVDYPTFYRAFKNEYGVSPRQMIQK